MAFGWGLYLRTRRELVASLRERAQQLEVEQQRSTELAREAERRRIAGRCTMSWPTGCPCSACTLARWSSGPAHRPRR